MTSNLHIQILGVMSVKWQDKRSSLQQVCKTLLKLKPKEGSFEKADSCPCDKYANCGTSYRPGNNPSLCVFCYGPVLLLLSAPSAKSPRRSHAYLSLK